LALRRLDAEPRNAWFIGDTLDEDISGAIEVGLTAFLLRPAGIAKLQKARHRSYG
jgi:FMN phosphatase YigB (HAD superfamily)